MKLLLLTLLIVLFMAVVFAFNASAAEESKREVIYLHAVVSELHEGTIEVRHYKRMVSSYSNCLLQVDYFSLPETDDEKLVMWCETIKHV
jgi:hypothetical protein